MTAKTTKARASADRAAAMLSRVMAEPAPVAVEAAPEAPIGAASASAEPVPVKRSPGRPRGKREVAARHTLNLDEQRQDALRRMAEDRGRSIHSLLLEAVDSLIGKPQRPGWTE